MQEEAPITQNTIATRILYQELILIQIISVLFIWNSKIKYMFLYMFYTLYVYIVFINLDFNLVLVILATSLVTTWQLP